MPIASVLADTPPAAIPPPNFPVVSARQQAGHDPSPKPPDKRREIRGLIKRRDSEITWIGAHNSAAVRTRENGWSLSGNQYFPLPVQLNSGIRLLQAQGHLSPHPNDTDGQIHLCHFNCALMDGGTLDSYLLTTKAWLEEHPTELLTILLVNAGVPLADYAKVFYRTGFDVISYVPPASMGGSSDQRGCMGIVDWPSVEDMVASGKRAVVFLSAGADEGSVPYLLPEFDYMFETPFSNYEPTPEYSCRPARPRFPPNEPVPDRLTLVNHFLYGKLFGFPYPYAKEANWTNGAGLRRGQLGEHAVRCRGHSVGG